MEVKLYGKKDCKLCESAIKKLEIMEIPFVKEDIEYWASTHPGWREDETVDIMAKHCLINAMIPMILIDGKPYNYTQAMRELKTRKKKEQDADAN